MRVEYVRHMGSDAAIVDAARVSFDKAAEHYTQEQNERLIRYLARHGHWTPFSQTAITLRVSAPIFVARQLFKHQVGGTINEVSRRYVSSQPEFYRPGPWRGAPVDGAKQGSAGEIGEQAEASAAFERVVSLARAEYLHLLALGVAPEQARAVLPQSMLTEWVWTGSVAFFARVVKQRLDPHAQGETQEIARAISNLIGPLFPVAWSALTGVEQ